jgi:hypothetical protein
MNRFLQALGAGFVGSLVLFIGVLIFGGSNEFAYNASFWGFWVSAIATFFIEGRK